LQKNRDRAGAQSFKKIPQKIRSRLTRLNYTAAERKCPQGLPIAKLMLEAKKKLET
jgi:predicted aldo/keto reductase-like oxidoreductase